jgi:squalene cyclase
LDSTPVMRKRLPARKPMDVSVSKGGLEAGAILARAGCREAAVLPVTNWAATIRPFRVMLRGRNLPAHFFCLIDFHCADAAAKAVVF